MMARPWTAMVIAGGLLTAFAAADWPQFRGVDNRSVAVDAKVPVSWSRETGENIAWHAPLPARGVSSPIVVSGKVVVTCAGGPTQDRLHVLCFDAGTGKPAWQRQFWATGRSACHPTSSVAAPTPASDGCLIFAFFSSNDLACFDLDGNLRWLRGLTLESPTSFNDTGMSSSPVVIGSTVIVQLESQGASFAIGIDTQTGETRWRVPRKSQPNWVSPTVLRGDTPAEDVLLLQSTWGLTVHEPATGKELARFEQPTEGIPSAAGSDGTIFLPSKGLTALRFSPASRNLEVLWNELKLGTGNSSPVIHEGRVYVLNRAGALTCADAATGEILWRVRMKGTYWSTPVLAGDYLYCVNKDGLAQVVRVGEEGEIEATNALDEPVFGSPAVADDGLFVRTDSELFKFATAPAKR
jgi:outer membrane protein assembly factor BamB